MIFSTLFSYLPLFVGVQCLASTIKLPQDEAIVPLASLGNIAALQSFWLGSLHTRLFYQDATGSIVMHGLANGPFTTGHTYGHWSLVPADQVLLGTPLAVSVLGDSVEVHLYYVSPDYKLREWRYINDAGIWGADCPKCIDHAGYSVADTRALYALEHQETNVLRVGFVSRGTFGTVSEAVSTDGGASWQLAVLPN